MAQHRLFFPALIGLLGLAFAPAPLLPETRAQEPQAVETSAVPKENWQAVALGRVEPRSGEIRLGSPVLGRIGEVLVKVNDEVFAGEAIIRIDDEEVRARHAKIETEVKLRERAQANPEPAEDADSAPEPGDPGRREVENAAAAAERALVDARAALDRAAAARRTGTGSEDSVAAAMSALSRARELLTQRQAELARFEAAAPSTMPNQLDGELAMARIELRGAEAALEKLIVRAPIAGTVLQLSARTGELASPSLAEPLAVLGDLTAMRVRAELDERDFGLIRIGQPVVVRSAAFPGVDVAGKVTSIAQIMEPGRLGARGQRHLTDIDVAEVMVELALPGPLVAGMTVDVYFQHVDASAEPP